MLKQLKINIFTYVISIYVLIKLSVFILEKYSALIQKVFLIISIVCILFFINKKITESIIKKSIILFLIFTVLGIIHFLYHQEIARILTPVIFFLTFIVGYLVPYKNNFFLSLIVFLLTAYFCYIYMSSFQLKVSSNRLGAKGFDINYIGFLCNVFTLIFSLGIKFNKKNIFNYLLLGLTLLCGGLTSSRGTLLAFFFTFFLLFYKEKKLIKFYFLVTVTILCVAFIVNFNEMIVAVIERFLDPSERDSLITQAFEFYLNSDFFYQVFGNSNDAYLNEVGLVTHNDPLRILISYGLLNFIIYHLMVLFILLDILKFIRNNKYKKQEKIYAMFILMLLFGYFFRGMFSNFFPLDFIFYFIGSFYGKKHLINEKYAITN